MPAVPALEPSLGNLVSSHVIAFQVLYLRLCDTHSLYDLLVIANTSAESSVEAVEEKTEESEDQDDPIQKLKDFAGYLLFSLNIFIFVLFQCSFGC